MTDGRPLTALQAVCPLLLLDIISPHLKKDFTSSTPRYCIIHSSLDPVLVCATTSGRVWYGNAKLPYMMVPPQFNKGNVVGSMVHVCPKRMFLHRVWKSVPIAPDVSSVQEGSVRIPL